MIKKRFESFYWERTELLWLTTTIILTCLGLPNAALARSIGEAQSLCEQSAAFYNKLNPTLYFYWCVDHGIEVPPDMGAIYVHEKELSSGKVWLLTAFSYTYVDDKYSLDISPKLPIIPSNSEVQGKRVLTTSDLVLDLKKQGAPASGIMISLRSSRNSTDAISNPVSATDSNGRTAATVSTRDQSGMSVITAADTKIQTARPGSITWLPAKYDNEFLVTCYIIADEASAAASPISTNVCGLPEKNVYRSSFLKGVMMNGSGTALDGAIIHYNSRSNCYNIDSCARTATGSCATVGTTIAVDPNVIPKHGTVNVDIIGRRIAQDTGNRITGYHIDEYVGSQPKLCKQLGRRYSGITFLKY